MAATGRGPGAALSATATAVDDGGLNGWWRRWRLWLLVPLPLFALFLLLAPVSAARLAAVLWPEPALACAERCALQGAGAVEHFHAEATASRDRHLVEARLCFHRAAVLLRALGADDDRSPYMARWHRVRQFQYAVQQWSGTALDVPGAWATHFSPDLWWRETPERYRAILVPQP